MTRVRVCGTAELRAGGLARVVAGGRELCIACTEDGDVFAISDVCSHEEASLSEGRLIGVEVECATHGSRFDVTTGAPTALPAEEPVPSFRVEVVGDDVLVELD